MFTLLLLSACSNLDEESWRGGAGRTADAGGAGGSEDSGTNDTAPPDSGDSATEGTDTAGCDSGQLMLVITARGSDGTDAEAHSFGEPITLAVAHENPCTDDIVFTTPTSCLVPAWSLSIGGKTATLGTGCSDATTTWRIPANTTFDAKQAAGSLDRGVYTLSATPDVTGSLLTTTFSIQ